MCGIAGIYHFSSGKIAETHVLKAMSEVLVHRGPDDEGYYAEGSAGLGFRRLAIIDLAGGRQPMCNEDGNVWTVFNGEIYNFRDLRKDLESHGHVFKTMSDTEVLVHGYEEWGNDVVNRLRGMFAFAIWDKKAKKMLLARDRLGKKPLYYTQMSGSLYFASELKSLLQITGLNVRINPLSVNLYLTYGYVPSPATIFDGIYRLQPAHVLECSERAGIKSKRYWDVSFVPKIKISLPEAVERVKELLGEATRIRMVADVPLGAFLSGGIDSSAVVGMMAASSERPVKTFSIGFAEQDYSELAFARIVARHFATDHNEFIVRPQMIDILPKLVWHYDQPYADPSALPSYYVAKETRSKVTVALNGDGGDESFAGYQRYMFVKLAGQVWNCVPEWGLQIIQSLSRTMPEKWLGKRLLRRIKLGGEYLAKGPEEANCRVLQLFAEEYKEELYSSAFKEQLQNKSAPGKMAAESYLSSHFAESGSNDVFDRILYADLHTYLPEDLLVKMDVATMANSLEARSPFLDHHLVEFAASLPSEWKIAGFTSKYLLKKAMDGFLPEAVLKRRKMGFGVPLEHWFRNELRDFSRDVLLSAEAKKREYFNMAYVEKLFSDHVSGVRDHSYRLWTLLMFELWHQVFKK